MAGLKADGPRVAILGAGSVGAQLGALLALGGVDITLYGRPRVLDPMRSAGVTIQLPDGSRLVGHPAIRTGSEDESRYDFVMLTVKAYAVQSSLNDIDKLVAPNGIVVAFQNGVGSDEFLVDRFGANRVISATSTISVGIDAPGVITQYTAGGGLAWAPYGAESSPIAAVLSATNLPVIRAPSPQSLRWSKLLLNAVGSPQCALLGCGLDEIVSDSRLFRVEQLAFRERVAVMRAAGINPIDLPGYRVRLAIRAMDVPLPLARLVMGRRMARGRGGKPPTLGTDVERGGPTENEFLNGATVALGSAHGVPTPVNDFLTAAVDSVVVDPKARGRYRGHAESLLADVRSLGVRV